MRLPYPGMLENLRLGASPVTAIILAKTIEQQAGHSFEATSLPGHLLHFELSGRVEQECNGRRYELTPGSVLWYHEDEYVRGRVLEGPWRFYTVNFIAPLLPPPPFEIRLFAGREHLESHFAAMIRDAEDQNLDDSTRLFRLHGQLNLILSELVSHPGPAAESEAPSELWWQLEAQLRARLDDEIDLALMERLSHRSATTITRACQSAVGLSPMKRIKQVRLSLARGLVQRSSLSMTEIAHRVGYPRLHEFSRDYRGHFGRPPSKDREASSD